jgi:SOS-response transcriptional repressor LexA
LHVRLVAVSYRLAERGIVRREAILAYFEDVLAREKRAPTLEEIGNAVGLASKHTVSLHCKRLVREGKLAYRKLSPTRGVYTLP